MLLNVVNNNYNILERSIRGPCQPTLGSVLSILQTCIIKWQTRILSPVRRGREMLGPICTINKLKLYEYALLNEYHYRRLITKVASNDDWLSLLLLTWSRLWLVSISEWAQLQLWIIIQPNGKNLSYWNPFWQKISKVQILWDAWKNFAWQPIKNHHWKNPTLSLVQRSIKPPFHSPAEQKLGDSVQVVWATIEIGGKPNTDDFL